MPSYLKFLPLFSFIALMSAADVYGITLGHSTWHPAVGTVGPSGVSLFSSPTGEVHPDGRPKFYGRGAKGARNCSGVLIAPRVVLTAAHCFDKNIKSGDKRSIFHLYEEDSDSGIFHNRDTVLGYPPGKTPSILDETPLRNTESIEGSFWVHPKYIMGNLKDPHDIAVLVLDTPPIGVDPAFISLDRTFPKIGDYLHIYGYGITGFGCLEERMGLRQMSMPITTVNSDTGVIQLIDEMTVGRYNEITFPNHKIGEISDSPKNGSSGGSGGTISIPLTRFTPSPYRIGTCKGDSGGPAFNDNGEIVAIVSVSEPYKEIKDGELISPFHRTQLAPIAKNIDWILSERESIIINGGGLCMDVHAPDMDKNGGKVQVWKCVPGAHSQSWFFNQYRQIVNFSGKCLDVHAPDFKSKLNGAKVHLWECVDAVSNQKWKFKNGNLVSDNGMCLDLNPWEISTNGSRVQLWECEDNTVNQHWYNY